VVLGAFNLMNKSFLESRKNITSWRPFQIIFIVSVMQDLVQDETLAGNYRNSVDLLYFPTGGGKTEAFLGLAVFQAFLDRLQGKKGGVSVFIKFPLRMLSAQQLQRVADILASAEKVRSNEIGGDADAFSVGYYVGDRNTPNKLVDIYNGRNVLSQIEASPEFGKKWQILQICPFCGNSTIKIKADQERIRLIHFCESCIRELPIYISDTEIYRYLPTIIVSTIDKMVTIGIQPNFRNILGKAHYKCKTHGFAPTNKCIEDSCSDRNNLEQITYDFDMSPSLLIQDEIHLLKESFGTLDSHYETGLDQLVLENTNGKKNLKVICSSATVSKDYENEIGQIYQRDIVKFPINYEIFSKRIKDKPQRIIVGLMPHSRTLINAIEKVLTETLKSLNDKALLLSNDSSLLDLYRVVLTYHNKKDDANALNRSVTTRISKDLEDAKYPPFGKHKLTGDEPFDKIKDVMGQIEGNNFTGTLIATSLVSHGIDLGQLNTMIFMGMPGNNAEYIQALSRVGRKLTSTGIVFVLFNPWRERDQSYYTNFSKFHELIEFVIEGTPINRWAEDAVKITLPGLFCSYIYNLAASKPGLEDVIKPFWFADHYEKKDITKDEILNFLNKSYRVSESPDPGRFSELIDQQVDKMISQIIDYRQDRTSLIGFRLKPYQPLTNFRSISQPVKLILDRYTERVVQDIDFSRGETE
jgi:superfamily II DNA/RNA helicase